MGDLFIFSSAVTVSDFNLSAPFNLLTVFRGSSIFNDLNNGDRIFDRAIVSRGNNH